MRKKDGKERKQGSGGLWGGLLINEERGRGEREGGEGEKPIHI